MRIFIIALAIVGVLVRVSFVYADMSSTNFIIRWDTIGAGGDDVSTSASYLLRDTLGNAAIGGSASASYDLRAGYRQGIFDQVITFDVFAQSNASERAATAFDGTDTITCDTTGLAVGDFVALVQDKGSGQVSGIGQIESVGVGTITVDVLTDGGTAPVIDGTNDFVYELVGTSAALGTLDNTVLSTAIVAFDVTVDVEGGYVVQAFDDGNLRSGANDVNDVADGAVTVGAEEYGGRSSDTTLASSTFDTADSAFTTAFQDVADEAAVSFESRNFVTLKASINGSTQDGSYAQALSFIVSGNY